MKIGQFSDGLKVFFCPGCQMHHGFDSRWFFNGDFERPTISPSYLVTIGRHPDPPDRCHSFVRDGQIEFLSDCTHSLAGQTVDLPDVEV
ncbi:DUF6527 family protein [Brevibacillus composti]|uniref:DUF6527 family protein n=1 Tax=Brevibacillus composti TaxID=2796470 RepID=UPI003898E8C6